MRSIFCIIVALLLPVSLISAMTASEAQAWQQDLRFMTAEMQSTHKNLYHSVSVDDFATMVAKLDAEIPSLTRAEVIVRMAQIVAAVGDGHTNIYPTRDPKIGFHTLPVEFTFFGDELYIRAAQPDQRTLLGAKVVRIGNLSEDAAYAAVRTMIGHENDGGARYWAEYLLAMPEVLGALHITSSVDDVPLTLATEKGELQVTLRAFAPVEMMSGDISTLFYRRPGWVDVRDSAPGPDPLWLREINVPFHFERIGDLLYVQINSVLDGKEETLVHFAQRVHDEIATAKPDKVAIDLRQNRGGNNTLIVPLIRAVIQSEGVDRPGHLFGIIGPATFSAAQNLADALEKYTNILFVGEPTGSRGNAYGDSRQIILPNSGITVRAATDYWQDWLPTDKRDAIAPQIPAALTFDAYSRKSDPALEAILAYQR